jgi:dolichol-phosphate mannosyltransferase
MPMDNRRDDIIGPSARSKSLIAQADQPVSPPTDMRGFVPVLSIIAPAFNERPNMAPLVQAVAAAMGEIRWELIVVDDDSPDRTAEAVDELARQGFPVRCIRRVGRRGLASAVVEGALASNAPYLAVIDADMQHDERVLPRMLSLLEDTDTDLVIGSRHIEGGSVGDWAEDRQAMSRLATRCARMLIGSRITDPMSGFFAVRRDVFHACIYDLSQQGYKILLDILTSSPRPLKVEEVPYVFRNRHEGESKLDIMVLAEFLFLLVEKLTKGLIPPRFVMFSLVGGIGLAFHLVILEIAITLESPFRTAQIIATIGAMSLNFLMNNAITYRPQRLRGVRMLWGYLVFCIVCSVGAFANIGVASLVLNGSGSWPVAGAAGAVMSLVFNFGAASQLVWSQRRRRRPVTTSTAG